MIPIELIQIIVALVFFAIFLLADTLHPLLSAGIIFIFLMWGYIAFDLSLAQKVFYPIGLVFFLAVKGYPGSNLNTNSSSADLNGPLTPGGIVNGAKFHIFSIIIGLAILGVMFFFSSVQGRIIGGPTLSISTQGFMASITLIFAPTLSMAIGLVENRMFIALLNILSIATPVFAGILGPLGFIAFGLPILLTCFAFGIFHIIAYAILWKLMIWAMFVMGLWIITYYMMGEDLTPGDTSHAGWNGFLTVGESLSFAL